MSVQKFVVSKFCFVFRKFSSFLPIFQTFRLFFMIFIHVFTFGHKIGQDFMKSCPLCVLYFSQFSRLAISKMRSAVEAVSADLILRKAYGFNEVFKGVEFERSESVALSHFLYHLAVATTAGFRVFLKV